MKVALLGYGRMGREVEKVLKMRQHEVVATFGREGLDRDKLRAADVAIEFSLPESAAANIKTCFACQVPVAVGTTGWDQELPAVLEARKEQEGCLLTARNFSLGVNLFFALNSYLARLINPFPQYKPSVDETHHTGKKDAPSGTAISLAEQISAELDAFESWDYLEEGQNSSSRAVPVTAQRLKDVPGTHQVRYRSSIDDITLEHRAHNRQGFALGAVLAAEFIQSKTGYFSMKDVLKIQ